MEQIIERAVWEENVLNNDRFRYSKIRSSRDLLPERLSVDPKNLRNDGFPDFARLDFIGKIFVYDILGNTAPPPKIH